MSAPESLPPCSVPLPWQQAQWQRLVRQVDEVALPHALLLTGQRHTGRERFAVALARLLLCSRPMAGTNCGHCHACVLSAAGSHGDFLWVAPVEKSRVIKVDQVRAAIDFTGRTAALGGAKVLVFSPAEAMNVNAANALLKSLEEPPPATYLILVSGQPHRIPATVRSRCQLLRLPFPDQQQSLDWLQGLTGDRGESERWLDLAEGMPLLAEALYRDPEAESLVKPRLACRALLAGKVDTAQAIAMLEEAGLEQVLEQLAAAVRNGARSAEVELLRSATGRHMFELLDEISALQRAVAAGANPNRQLMCEVMLEKLQFLLGTPGPGGSIAG